MPTLKHGWLKKSVLAISVFAIGINNKGYTFELSSPSNKGYRVKLVYCGWTGDFRLRILKVGSSVGFIKTLVWEHP